MTRRRAEALGYRADQMVILKVNTQRRQKWVARTVRATLARDFLYGGD